MADELFFTGTGAQVKPILSVDKRPIGNGKPGPITTKLNGTILRNVPRQNG